MGASCHARANTRTFKLPLLSLSVIVFSLNVGSTISLSLQNIGTSTTIFKYHCNSSVSTRLRASTGDENVDDDLNINFDVNSRLSRRRILESGMKLSSTLILMCPSPSAHAAVSIVDADNDDGSIPSNSSIETRKKPFATMEALQPAVRVKLSIDRATALATEIINSSPSSSSSSSSSSSKSIQQPAVEELENLILQPRDYLKSYRSKVQGVPSKPAERYLEAYKSTAGDLPFQRFLVRNGDVSAWRELKKKEKEGEKDNEVRAALNAYTDVLSFSGDSYVLNVDRATRSSMVREDRLPDVKQVITSDMGMRYLYRNQVLTAMDDVRAELEYQLRSSGFPEGAIDATELLNLLKEAQRACDRWFSLIAPDDVREAVKAVELEG